MEAVIKEPQGTAHRLYASAHFSMAGKTGTAQIFTIKQEEKYDKDKVAAHLRDHTLFMAFAPVAAPKIAIATISSNGISDRIMDIYLNSPPH